MRTKKSWIAVIAVGVCVAAASHALSQDKAGKAQEGMPAMSAEEMAHMQEYMKLMQPGEAHKHLHFYVGVWDTVSKVWMGGPGTEAMESTGTSTFKSVLGGNWIMEDHTGSMMGMPYLGMGMMGYDNYKNLYVGTWFSNMGTEMLQMAGSRNPKTGVVTMYGAMDEPQLSVHSRTVKYVMTPTDEDHFTFAIIDLHASDDYKMIELMYTRRK
ncbi:MAG: DUF1579 family protein [Planctomycetota bacterium]|nr:DUF1579 family protein [Planctomycetota bacterium]